MVDLRADIVICGAGIAGVSAAYFLSTRAGIRDVILVDELPPLEPHQRSFHRMLSKLVA